LAKGIHLNGGLMPATADGSVKVQPMECWYSPKNGVQRALSEVWAASSLIVLTGEPGTGKSAGAMGQAMIDLFANRIEKIIISRPPVPSGRSIGFLTGDLVEKMTPWVQSLADACSPFTDATFGKLGPKLEIADIGLVQGRTVRNAVLIVDEASNLFDRQQCLCLATRVGENAKVIWCGDPNQSNLNVHPNPFVEFSEDHRGTKGVAVLTATRADVIRSGFCKTILDAEDAIQDKRRKSPGG